MVSAIIVADENWAVSVDGNIPFTTDEIKKYYRTLIYGNNVVIGRKTFDEELISFAGANDIFVVTQEEQFSSIEDWKMHPLNGKATKQLLKNNVDTEEKFYVLGGLFVFKHSMKWCKEINLIKVYREFEGDNIIRMRSLDKNPAWGITDNSRLMLQQNTQYRFCTYTRRNKIL